MGRGAWRAGPSQAVPSQGSSSCLGDIGKERWLPGFMSMVEIQDYTQDVQLTKDFNLF